MRRIVWLAAFVKNGDFFLCGAMLHFFPRLCTRPPRVVHCYSLFTVENGFASVTTVLLTHGPALVHRSFFFVIAVFFFFSRALSPFSGAILWF